MRILTLTGVQLVWQLLAPTLLLLQEPTASSSENKDVVDERDWLGLPETPEVYWNELISKGILNGKYFEWLRCNGTVWDDFRVKFVEHMESGAWNMYPEHAWVHAPANWQLLKLAENLTETFRAVDFGAASVELSPTAGTTESVDMVSDSPMTKVEVEVFLRLVISHLRRVSDPWQWTPSDFGSTCLPGLVAAIVVMGRVLATLGHAALAGSVLGHPGTPHSESYLSWRIDMGFAITALIFGEGAWFMDLIVSVPGSFSSLGRLLESTVNYDKQDIVVGPDSMVMLGSPRRLRSVTPTRLPPWHRYHSATDPMGTTAWGRAAQKYMEERQAKLLRVVLTPALLPHIGPARVPTSEKDQQRLMERGRGRLRMISWVHGHGALDLEVPALLQDLFPTLFTIRYVLHSVDADKFCQNTIGSLTMAQLCADASSFSPHLVASGVTDDEVWTLDPLDPRLRFATEAGGSVGPDIVTVTGWIQAIWAQTAFPEAKVLLFFGPPLLLNSEGIEITDANSHSTQKYWENIEALLKSYANEEALIASESLFRAEQFFYQAGVYVPFLRPMSVWVNATYKPRIEEGRSHVLVHARGRLRYETAVIRMMQHLSGPTFPHKIHHQVERSIPLIPFEELAGFFAIVILPWSPELCMLRHIFKMRVPIFAPHRRLLKNMVFTTHQRFAMSPGGYRSPYSTPAPFSDRQRVEAVHPYDPFVDTIRWPGDAKGKYARAYWTEYSEYVLLPFVQHFVSVANLLDKLSTLNGLKLSSQMQHAYLLDMEEMRSFWVDTLVRLFCKSQ